jgi:ABC-type branched-subunit amino acid transport system substrate-binding protein
MGRRFVGVLVCALGALCSVAAHAQTQPLVIGLTTPLSGLNAAFGLGLQHGAQLAVDRANAAGGIGGRPLLLLSIDDGGDPGRAAANATRLLERGAVAITGVHGARSATAVAEVLASVPGGAPLVAPATGAESLRDPPMPGVFHWRAGVAEEASAAVLHLDTLGVTRFALVTQSDPLGDAGRERMEFELMRIAMRPAIRENLDAGATPTSVQASMSRICAIRPEAVILALDAVLARAAVAAARAQPCAMHYFVFSEAGAALAVPQTGRGARHPLAGLLVTQVVPHPGNALHPLVSEYQRARAAHGAAPGSHPSLEGYLAVRVIQEALRPCGREASRACVIQSLRSRSFELPGMTVQFGLGQRRVRPFVEITLLDGEGRFRR